MTPEDVSGQMHKEGGGGALSQTAGFDVPILLYHHVLARGAGAEPVAISVDLFEQHLDVLARHGFNTLTVSKLIDGIEGRKGLPKKPVIITFDDGFTSFGELATPALVARRMVATVYALAGDLGGYNHWDESTGIPQRRLMDERDLRQVASAGMEIGVHGWRHRDLTKCSPAELHQEIGESKAELENKLGIELDHFAYAYGHYSEAILPLISAAGYRSAMAVRNKEPTVTSKYLAMRRISLHSSDSPARFRVKISGMFLKYSAWRERRTGNRRWPGSNDVGWH